jgi:uncharacterized protein (TIGR02145 family)
VVTTYEIDLSDGTIVYGIDERNDVASVFSLISNRPGLLEVNCNFPLTSTVMVSQYNLKGVCLERHTFDFAPGNHAITWPYCRQEPGLISFESGGYRKTFKVTSGCLEGEPIGISAVTNYKTGKMSIPAGIKSTNVTEFDFTPGDSVRFTVYQFDIYSAALNIIPANGDSLTLNIWRKCPGAHTVTDYDGNIYTTVRIGNQCWFRENAKSIHYADGVPLTDGTGVGTINYTNTTNFWFNYNDDPQWSELYGKLYTWYGAARSWSGNLNDVNQGICPNGWHLPSDTEWQNLEMFLGMSQHAAADIDWRGTDEGGKLKATTHWKWPNKGATNLSGFNALGGGYRRATGGPGLILYEGYWWTSSHWLTNLAMHRLLDSDNTTIYRRPESTHLGFSVRCMKDN